MGEPWPSREERERYIRFIELELLVMKSAAAGGLDADLLAEFNAFIGQWFPRTRAFIESRLASDPASGFSDEIRAVAWAEARAGQPGTPRASVPGEWTPEEIARDINECFSAARERADI
ncbi:MAG TPA: hypothetical protein VIK02_07625 [Candidatus Anoxymicrobiaceae bacterium]